MSPTINYERRFRKLKARKAKFGFEITLSFDEVEIIAAAKEYVALYRNSALWIELPQGNNIVTVKVYTDDETAAYEFGQLFAYKE